MDLISQLPEHILHNILNRLSLKEAVQTCVLSKAWNRIESRIPFMRFYKTYFPSAISPMDMLNYVEKRVERFSQNNDNLAISSFDLVFITLGSDYNQRIASLLERVIKKGVEQLKLHLGGCNLPPFVLQSETLISLNLYGCKCDPRQEFQLPKLTELQLCGVNMDNHFIERLTRGCPSLLCLIIEYCELTTLQVTCHDTLQTVEVIKCRKLINVEIATPNLHAIRYVGNSEMSCQLFFSRNKPCDGDKLTLAPLKKLTLECVTVKSCWLRRQVSICETLTLNNVVCVGDSMVISSPEIRNLNIFNCHNMYRVARIDCPNLQSLVYIDNRLPFCSACEFKSLRNIKIEFQIQAPTHTVWYNQLKDLFQKFGSIKELIKQVVSYERRKDLIILDGFKEFMIPVCFDIKHLERREKVLISSISNSNWVTYIWNSMTTCPKRSLYVVSTECSNYNLSHVLFDKFSRLRESNCCQNISFNEKPCWRHRLLNVSKDSTTNIIPPALRSQQFDQCQVTKIMLTFTWT